MNYRDELHERVARRVNELVRSQLIDQDPARLDVFDLIIDAAIEVVLDINLRRSITLPIYGHQSYLTTAEAAELFNISQSVLHKMRYKGNGPPAVKIGRAVRPNRFG